MKKVLALIICLVMLLSLACFASAEEQPLSWAVEEVNAAISAGLVPDAVQHDYTSGISRADLSKILSVLLDKVCGKEPTSSDANFTDTTDSDVLKAADLGIINGYKQDDGTYMFKPENTLKRCEMAAIVNRVAKLCGKTTTGYDSLVTFADTVDHWCRSELGWPVHAGIVKGTSETTFSPENTLTTEQTIMMVYRLYNELSEITITGPLDPAIIEGMRIGSDYIVEFEQSNDSIHAVETMLAWEFIPFDENFMPVDGETTREIPADQYIERANAMFTFPSDYFSYSLLERYFPETNDPNQAAYHPSTNTFTVCLLGGSGGGGNGINNAFPRYVDNNDGTVTFYYGRREKVDFEEEILPYLSDDEKYLYEEGVLWKIERDGKTYVEAWDRFTRTSQWYGPELADESISVTLAYSESNQYGRFVSYSDSLR